MFFEIYMFLFGIFFIFFGIGLGLIISFTFIGLVGGLIGLLLFNNKMVAIPNPKVAIFVGYIAMILLFIVLPFIFILLSSVSSYSYGSSSPLAFFLMFLSIPFIHCAVTIGAFIFLENSKAFNNNYFALITAYFLASLILVPFTMIFGFMGMLGGFGSMFGSLGSFSSLSSII